MNKPQCEYCKQIFNPKYGKVIYSKKDIKNIYCSITCMMKDKYDMVKEIYRIISK